MNKYHYLIIPIILLFQGCTPDEISFIDKEFVIQGTTNKVLLKVPKSCESFDTGVKINIDAMVEYAGQKAEFEANFAKITLISEYSDRLRAITTAQCRILQTSVIINTNNSDLDFYNDIVKNYTEYQKIRDIINSNPSQGQKDEITKTILSVYKTMYNNKKDELYNYIDNLVIKFDVYPGTEIKIFKNEQFVGSLVGHENPPVQYILDKKYLLPEPDETIQIKFVANVSGFMTTTKTFSLSQLRKSTKEVIDLTPKVEPIEDK